ncbi:MAG TPA: response regulator [Polyangiaceae bacterium]|nr:response regulator [Polyangiaceae bacterium]
MRWSFRSKLIAIVGIAAASSLLVLLLSDMFARRGNAELAAIRDRYIPEMELGPQLQSRFDALKRGMQDAVAASDLDALDQTRELEAALLDRLARARSAMDPEVSASVRGAVEAYYGAAYEVSARMIRGDTGETVGPAIQRMQERQTKAADAISRATAFDRAKLARAFGAAVESEETANRVRQAISAGGVLLVMLVALWLTRGVLRSLEDLTTGLARFGRGDFQVPIAVTARDELGDLAAHANRMAANLDAVARERESDDWRKTAIEGLSSELRGELEPEDAVRRAARFLTRKLGAAVGTGYIAEPGRLRLVGPAAVGEGAAEGTRPRSFALGEGLVGRAAEGEEVVIVDDPPADYVKVETGLGSSPPRCLAFLPLRREGKLSGLLEFAFLSPCPDATVQLLSAVRELTTVTLESAESRAALARLLGETRAQAERLARQEEALRENNEELRTQQEELRAANETLNEQQRTLGHQNRDLEAARAGIQQKADELSRVSKYKSQFLANMSHELRTPLNSMLLLSQLLSQNETGNLTDQQVEYCRTVYGAGKDLLTLINQILDLAKIESGRQEIVVESVSLRDVAAHAERVFRPLANDRGLSFVVEVGADAPRTILTDRHRLERILTNLLGNATKFTEKGRVSLRIGRPDPAIAFNRGDLSASKVVAFAVSDTGIGVPPEAQERIFAPFEQADGRTDRKYGGTGLGLAISRESALLMGGELRLESAPGRGSTFTCYLPESPPGNAEHREAGPSPKGSLDRRPVADDRHSLRPDAARLLVVEDDPVVAGRFVALIREHGLQAIVASTGEEGLRLARELAPRGIALDVRLPDMDGWTVMDRLKQDPVTRGIPVHFVSSVDAPERGLALGAVGYLTKPATREDLVGVVRTLSLPSRDGRAVLVVEDDAAAAESLGRLLSVEKIPFEHVSGGAAALAALRSRRFACMILDLGLPDVDGLAVLETLSEGTSLHPPPVVVYTARSLTDDEMGRLEAYAASVVLKDGTEDRLREVLLSLVGKADETARRPPETDGDEPSPVRGRKILVADDDMRTIYAVSALLRGRGAEVLVADNGSDALAVLAEHPDVGGVLMDVMMPTMDGYEAMRRLRADPAWKNLPVIALTAKAMQGERERCLEAGASDYLPKPFDGDALLRMLDSWLGEGRAP